MSNKRMITGLDQENDLFRPKFVPFDIKMISKESIFDYARRMYIFLRFRRLCTCPSDPPSVVACIDA